MNERMLDGKITDIEKTIISLQSELDWNIQIFIGNLNNIQERSKKGQNLEGWDISQESGMKIDNIIKNITTKNQELMSLLQLKG